MLSGNYIIYGYVSLLVFFLKEEKLNKYLLFFIDHTGLLICNALIGTILLFTTGAIATFISSIIFTGILVPLSFLFWFRPGYKAFR